MGFYRANLNKIILIKIFKTKKRKKRKDRTYLSFEFDEHFHLYYREKFRMNPELDKTRLFRELELNKYGLRLLNVIISMTNNNEEF